MAALKKKDPNEQLWFNLAKLFNVVAILLALVSPLVGVLATAFLSESGRKIPAIEQIQAFAMGMGVLLVPSVLLYFLSRKVKEGNGIARKVAGFIGIIITLLFLSMLL